MVDIKEVTDCQVDCKVLAERARQAARSLSRVPQAAIDAWLMDAAHSLEMRQSELVLANQRDVAEAQRLGLAPALIDRLSLTDQRIAAMAEGIRQVARLPNPVGEVIEKHVRPNGLEISKMRVPLGVIFFIYESRPNVTVDAASICVKSGNAVILRGGKEASYSNQMLTAILRDSLARCEIPLDVVQRVETPDRTAIDRLLQMNDHIDLVIPRGGADLIRRVVSQATMPVLKHFDGNCHVYVERTADLDAAVAIVVNAKCQRMGVCNACESLLVDAAIAEEFLVRLAKAFATYSIEIRGDASVCRILNQAIPATDLDWRTEYLGPIISIRIVPGIDEAIEHIHRYGSKHTDAIVTQCAEAAETFVAEVDSAAVMVNASTRFHDGFEFGLGAEIGISTDKFHARGPCGLKELTTYKYVVRGAGQIRSG